MVATTRLHSDDQETLERATEPEPATTPLYAIDRGARLGRYVILRRVGVGGMGQVLSAHDPDLDRVVAIKVLKPAGARTQTRRARLQREAQVLARLHHPNVVAVHDVGETEGLIYIAMEFVDGLTMAKWARGGSQSGRRPWHEIVAAFIAAGRGLEAAHAKGLVHRDVKPENVMVDGDGRVVVMDFGLARAAGFTESSPAPSNEVDSGPEGNGSVIGSAITMVGKLVGTPAYMAPELYARKPPDARSDQFGFCVSMWEVLFDAPPFVRGDHLLRRGVTDEDRIAPPKGSRVPGWVRQVLERGLRLDPAERWPSMSDLLAALEDDPRRRRRLLVIGGIAALAVAGSLGAWALDRRQTRAACDDAGATVAAVWNDTKRDQLRASLLASGSPIAETTADRTEPWLDRWAEQWADTTQEVCADVRIEGRRSPTWEERARRCLDERRDELAATVEAIGRGTPEAVRNAVVMVSKLDAPQQCADPVWLDRQPAEPEDPRTRAAISEVRKTLGRSSALRSAGGYAEALELAQTASRRAKRIEWPPLWARARWIEGLSLAAMGRPDDARVAALDAYYTALQLSHARTAVDAALFLALDPGGGRARDDAPLWLRSAEALMGDDLDAQARWLEVRGLMRRDAGEHAASVEDLKQAVVLRSEAEGSTSPGVLRARTNLAGAYYILGEFDDAAREFAAIADAWTEAVGPAHPAVAHVLASLALAYEAQGRVDEARAQYERAITLMSGPLGPDHPEVVQTRINLGALLLERGQPERAAAIFEQAIDQLEARSPGDPAAAFARMRLAIAHLRQGKDERARGEAEAAVQTLDATLGPDNLSTIKAHLVHGVTLTTLGRPADAEAELRKTLEAFERTTGLHQPDAASARLHLAEALVAQGKVAPAIAEAEAGRDLRRELVGPDDPATLEADTLLVDLYLEAGRHDAAEAIAGRLPALLAGELEAEARADAHLALARVAWQAGRDRPTALEHAAAAREGFDALGFADGRGEVDAWLQAHHLEIPP